MFEKYNHSTRTQIEVNIFKCEIHFSLDSFTDGKCMACMYRVKFIEVSVGINHNVDELLAGTLSQIRVKREQCELQVLIKDNYFNYRKKTTIQPFFILLMLLFSHFLPITLTTTMMMMIIIIIKTRATLRKAHVVGIKIEMSFGRAWKRGKWWHGSLAKRTRSLKIVKI